MPIDSEPLRKGSKRKLTTARTHVFVAPGRGSVLESAIDYLFGIRQGKYQSIRRTKSMSAMKQGASWRIKRENVHSDKWRANDLDGQSVEFWIVTSSNGYIHGLGRFHAI